MVSCGARAYFRGFSACVRGRCIWNVLLWCDTRGHGLLAVSLFGTQGVTQLRKEVEAFSSSFPTVGFSEDSMVYPTTSH